jgi:hypothetical protein
VTSLDRAKAYLKGRGARLALQILPLAMAVSSAKAVVVTPLSFVGSSGFFSTSSLGSQINPGWSIGSSAVGQFNGVTGVKVFGNGSSTAPSSGCFACASISAVSNLQFDYSGYFTGTLFSSQSMPIAWTFTATTGDSSAYSWQLAVNITSSLVGQDQLFDTGILSGGISGTPMTGSALMTLPASPSSWGVVLKIFADTPTTLTLDIPSSSIDLNAVPEPASLLLFGSGAAALLLFRRRYRRS